MNIKSQEIYLNFLVRNKISVSQGQNKVFFFYKYIFFNTEVIAQKYFVLILKLGHASAKINPSVAKQLQYSRIDLFYLQTSPSPVNQQTLTNAT